MEVIAWEVVVSVMACMIICLIFVLYPVSICADRARAINEHTSKASINSEAACFEGADKLCCADIRFIRSQTCCRVGALVTDAKWSCGRVPGGSTLPGSAYSHPHKKLYLTIPLRNQHDSPLLGYLILETPQWPWNTRYTIFVSLDAFSFPPSNAQRPLFQPGRSQCVLIRSIEGLVRERPPSFTRCRFGWRGWSGWLRLEM